MQEDDFKEYLEKRYKDQVEWYSNAASKNKTLYRIFQWTVIVLSILTPVLVTSLPEEYKWISTVSSILLAIGTSGLATFKFNEHWINYRTISEALKSQKYYYDAGLNEYSDSENKMENFVGIIEAMIKKENSLWELIIKKEEKAKNTKGGE